MGGDGEVWVDYKDDGWKVSIDQGGNWEVMESSGLSDYLDSRGGPWLFEKYSKILDHAYYISVCNDSQQWLGLMKAFMMIDGPEVHSDLPLIIFKTGQTIPPRQWVTVYKSFNEQLTA